ncbi:MAG: hypothetical protein ACRDF7_00530 [Candidatus Limnocylindrales bacterium]
MNVRTGTRPTATALPTAADVAFATTTVVLTLVTAGIHAYLGGLLFLTNAAGYSTLALALIVPIPLARRYRWVVRLALLGFTLATMAGWLAFGARIPLAFLDKGIEALLVAFVIVQLYRLDGGPLEAIRDLFRLGLDVLGRLTGRAAR